MTPSPETPMHTPTRQWGYGKIKVDPVYPHQIVRIAEKTHLIRIASVNKRFPNYAEMAAHFVRCVNSHAAMVEALKAQEEVEAAEMREVEALAACVREMQMKRPVSDSLKAERDAAEVAVSAARVKVRELRKAALSLATQSHE